MKTFLLISPQGLGDALEATPILGALKSAEPTAAIDVLVLRSGPKELFEGLRPLTRHVIYLPFWEKGPLRFILGALILPFRPKYDAVFLPYPAARREYHLLGLLVRAKERYVHRYAEPTLSNFLKGYSKLVEIAKKPTVFRNLDLVSAAGLSYGYEPSGYIIPSSWTNEARQQGRVVMHVGTIAHNGLEARRWPEGNYIELANRATAKGYQVVFLSGPAEEDLTRSVASRVPGSRIYRGSLDQVARFLSTSDAVVANDSGIAHMSAGVGTPTLALFGPTPTEHGAFGSNAIRFRPSVCPPCFDVRITDMRCALNIDFSCLKHDITVEMVEQQLDGMLTKSQASQRRSFEARPLKILIFNWRDIRHPKSGGAEEYLHRQATRWIADGHQVTWVAAGFQGAASEEMVDGICVIRRGGEYSIYAWAPIVYLLRLRKECDVIIDAENGIPFFTPLFSRKPKICVMHHVHKDVLLAELPFPLNYLGWALEVFAMPRVYRNTDFVAVSESTREDMLRLRYSAKPIEIVHNGVDHERLRPGSKSERPTILYLGRVVRYKRIPDLIRSFQKVRDRIQDAELIIAGAGNDLATCIQLASELGLGSDVRFEGFVSEERKRKLLAGAWVFAQPSRVEGWGISVIEAAASGTPSVALRVPGLRDSIVDGVTGILADDWDGFATGLFDVLSDKPLRDRLSMNALVRSAEFQWAATATQTLDLLRRVAPLASVPLGD